MEGHSVKRLVDKALEALVLVRIGQELGSDSPLARHIHGIIEIAVSFFGSY